MKGHIDIYAFYINRQIRLTKSNFDDKMIKRIMLTFRLALNANFFMKYKSIFRSPSFEECKEILEKRLEEKKKLRMYVLEVLSTNFDEGQIKKEIMGEIV